MYKILSFVFITLSSTALFRKGNIKDKNTRCFLFETVEILRIMKIYCGIKTYPRLFADEDMSDYSYYADFVYENKSDFFNSLSHRKNLEESRIKKAESVFSSLGKKGLKAEREYFEAALPEIAALAESYRKKYEKNRQIDMIAGFCVGIMIFMAVL